MFDMLKLYVKNKMWILMIALLAAAVFYAYSIKDSIKVQTKPGCSSCPHRNNEDEKAKLD